MSFIIEIFKIFIDRKEFFLRLLIEHLYISTIAIILIFIIGVSLGVFITRHQKLANVTISFVNFLYTIPSLALFGLLIPFTGIGQLTTVIALVIYGLIPILRNTYVGIMEVDHNIIEAARGMGSTKRQILFRIQLPLATPIIIAGMRTTVVMTIGLATIGAFIGGGGLGVGIWRGITTDKTSLIAVSSILVAACAVSADILFGALEKLMNRKLFGKSKKI